jgi:hypothetical protein
MPAKCDRPGLAFQYPENWTLEDDAPEAGRDAVSVHTPGGGFLSISRHAPSTDPKQLATAAFEALREEYPSAEAHDFHHTLGGREMIGYDVDFYCLDLTNRAKVRCFRGGGATYAVFSQAEGREFDELEPVFAAITVSLVQGIEGP